MEGTAAVPRAVWVRVRGGCPGGSANARQGCRTRGGAGGGRRARRSGPETVDIHSSGTRTERDGDPPARVTDRSRMRPGRIAAAGGAPGVRELDAAPVADRSGNPQASRVPGRRMAVVDRTLLGDGE